MKISGKLKSNKPHDTRSPDYDDWELNGDILFWNPVLKEALELSSMGIRVDQDTLKKQLKIANAEDRLKLSYHRMLMDGKLLYYWWRIGQSRMYVFLGKEAYCRFKLLFD